MSKKVPKKPDLPKPRDFFPPTGPRWLKVEPARLAMLGGLFFGTLVMVFYFVRQLFGVSMDPTDVILGVAKTFLASYAGIGFFTWYLLRVADRELVKKTKKPETRKAPVEDELKDTTTLENTGLPPEESEEHT